jgi:hypothetical protein
MQMRRPKQSQESKHHYGSGFRASSCIFQREVQALAKGCTGQNKSSFLLPWNSIRRTPHLPPFLVSSAFSHYHNLWFHFTLHSPSALLLKSGIPPPPQPTRFLSPTYYTRTQHEPSKQSFVVLTLRHLASSITDPFKVREHRFHWQRHLFCVSRPSPRRRHPRPVQIAAQSSTRNTCEKLKLVESCTPQTQTF